MRGVFVGGLLVLVIVIAGFWGATTWTRRSRSVSTPATGAAPTSAPAGAAGKGDGEHGTGVRAPRHISLLTEAIGYVGTILVLAGVIAAVGEQWPDIGHPARLAILVAGTVIFLAIGFVTLTSTEPAFKRLTAISWAVSVAGFAGSAAVVNQFYDTSGETAFVTIATTTTAYAAALWWANKRALQHAVLFLGVMLTAASIIVRSVHDPQQWIVVMTLWVLAVAWTTAGWVRVIPPWWVGVPLGLVVTLAAPAFLPNDSARYSLGIATAVAVMALSVAAKLTPALAFGAVALLGYVVGAVQYYFGDTLGVPAALAVAGVFILVVAVVVARLLPLMRRKPPAQGPPSTTAQPPVQHAA